MSLEQGKDPMKEDKGATSASAPGNVSPSATTAPYAKVVPRTVQNAGPINRIEDPNLRGLVIRQETQRAEAYAQALGLPASIGNKYKVAALPGEVIVKHRPGDERGWKPTAEELKVMEHLLFVQEESSMLKNALFFCCGLNNKRPFRMRFYITGGGEVYAVNRPFRCGGECCCPLEMNVYRRYNKVADEEGSRYEPADDILIGRVHQDFENYGKSCGYCCLACTNLHNIQRAIVDEKTGQTRFETAFTLTANACCCGPTNNCCGATPFRNDAVFVIHDTSGLEVGFVQKTFAGKGDWLGACCRCCCFYDNYILEFPEGATTADDRMLILTSIFQLDYQFFEQTGGNGGD